MEIKKIKTTELLKEVKRRLNEGAMRIKAFTVDEPGIREFTFDEHSFKIRNGLTFFCNKKKAESFAANFSKPTIYEVSLDVSRVYDPAKSRPPELRENYSDLLYHYKTRDVAGLIRKASPSQLSYDMIDYGIVGFSETLSDGSIEYSIFDEDAITIISSSALQEAYSLKITALDRSGSPTTLGKEVSVSEITETEHEHLYELQERLEEKIYEIFQIMIDDGRHIHLDFISDRVGDQIEAVADFHGAISALVNFKSPEGLAAKVKKLVEFNDFNMACQEYLGVSLVVSEEFFTA
jgi:hypothetical protein